jgi:tripartite-type tricarboxylate transporter receptor subunit TctC
MNRNPLSPCFLAAALALAVAPTVAPAQSVPSRPVRIIVPTSPGGATDAFARALAPRLGQAWRLPVLVENRPGANQIVGAEHVSKAVPDGTTLLISDASSFVMNPHLYKKLPYNGLKSFTPITVLVRFPRVIAVHAEVAADTFQQFVALAKAKPGSFSYGSFGLGSSAHISVDYLKNLLEIDLVHVPYKARAPRSPIFRSDSDDDGDAVPGRIRTPAGAGSSSSPRRPPSGFPVCRSSPRSPNPASPATKPGHGSP